MELFIAKKIIISDQKSVIALYLLTCIVQPTRQGKAQPKKSRNQEETNEPPPAKKRKKPVPLSEEEKQKRIVEARESFILHVNVRRIY